MGHKGEEVVESHDNQWDVTHKRTSKRMLSFKFRQILEHQHIGKKKINSENRYVIWVLIYQKIWLISSIMYPKVKTADIRYVLLAISKRKHIRYRRINCNYIAGRESKDNISKKENKFKDTPAIIQQRLITSIGLSSTPIAWGLFETCL